MRQVKAREARSGRAARTGRRGKTAARTSAHRSKRGHHEPEEYRSFDPEGTLQWLSESFPFRHPMLTLTLALIAFSGIAGIVAGGYVSRSEAGIGVAIDGVLAKAGFAVREIHLTGNERTAEEVATSAIGVERGQSIFAIDPQQARDRLLELPWISEAEVRRQFPDTVAVRVTEKRPFALWRNGNGLTVIERSGAIITRQDADSFSLPLIIGNGAPEAAASLIDALSAYKAINTRLREMQRVGERRWDLILDGNVKVSLPETEWEAQLAELERLITEQNILERDIEIIDLRYPENYIFRLHNGDSRTAPRRQRA